MMGAPTLEDLIRDVLAGEGPDRDIDHRTAWHLQPAHWRRIQNGRMERLHMGLRPPRWVPWNDANIMPPRYTGSHDAAISVKPLGMMWRVGNDGEGADPARFKAELMGFAEEGCPAFVAVADDPFRAMLGAALRARAAMPA